MTESEALVRLQKVLAQAGVGSRRACEELIAAGRVAVNGQVATLGDRVNPDTSVITVDGQRVTSPEPTTILLLHKPAGVVTTMSDERGRPCVGDLVAHVPERVVHVGRLDTETEGLLVLTNDGELTHRLTHPRYGVTKTYIATVQGSVPSGLPRRLRTGVALLGEERPVVVDECRILSRSQNRAVLELSLHEGRKHVVRRVLAEVGLPVVRLVRTRVGPVDLTGLAPGQLREVTLTERHALYTAVQM